MEELSVLKGLMLEKKGIFSLENIYHKVKEFLKENDYAIQEKKHDAKNNHKGEIVEIKIEAIRDITDFIQFSIKTEIKAEELIDSKGKLKIKIDGSLNLDYMNKWGKHKKMKAFVFENYKKRLKKVEIEHYSDKLGSEINELIESLKEILEIYK